MKSIPCYLVDPNYGKPRSIMIGTHLTLLICCKKNNDSPYPRYIYSIQPCHQLVTLQMYDWMPNLTNEEEDQMLRAHP